MKKQRRRRHGSKERSGRERRDTALVESLAAGAGDGVVHIDGHTVFLPGTVPGDTVRLVWSQTRRGWTRGRVTELVEPSLHRVAPICPAHEIPPSSGGCGGCPWLSVSRPVQLEAKRAIVDRALRVHHVRWEVPSVEEVGPSAGYRWRARFGVASDGRVGFRRAGSNEILPVDECPMLTHPADVRLCHGLTGSRELSVQWNTRGQVALHVERGSIDVDLALERFGERLVCVTSGRRLIHGDGIILEEDPPFTVTAGGFSQAGPWANRALVDAAVQMLRPVADTSGRRLRILELYAGAGNITRRLTDLGQVTAVEADPDSVSLFPRNAPEARLVRLPVESLDAGDLPDFDVLVLDPPRSGISPEAFSIIRDLTFRHVLLFSCDPMNGARDLSRFADISLSIREMRVLDTMPGTPHFEVISLLERSF